jgi:hypothetical protein
MTNQFLGIIALALPAMPLLMGQLPVRLDRPPRPDAQTGPVIGRPFSATEVRRATEALNDGTQVDQPKTSLFYRDDQGRMRAESSTNVMIYDPVARFYYSLRTGLYNSLRTGGKQCWQNAIQENASSGSIAVVGNQTLWGSGVSRLPVARGSATQVTENLPEQTINGVTAKGTRVTVTIAARTFSNDQVVKIVNERWYSDDLQALVRSSNSDPRFGVTTYELTNIVQAAPDAKLFQIPADLVCGSEPFFFQKTSGSR